MLKRVVFAAVVLGSCGLLAVQNPLTGQEAKAKKTRGRLPTYYANIVSAEQRQQIYGLQEKYARQITALNEQLESLQRQRDGEIENLLSAEQKEQLKAAREQGAAKRKKTTTAKQSTDGEGGEASAEAKPPRVTKKAKTK